MLHRSGFTVLTVTLAITACSDPAGPCDGPDACEVTGIDLAVIDSRLAEGVQTGTDPVTGLPVYSPGSVSIEFTIVNRGDVVSGPQPLSNGDTVPPLEPGWRFLTRVAMDYTGQYTAIQSPPEDFDARRADLRNIRLDMPQGSAELAPEDADTANNTMMHEFHVAIPIFTGTVSNISEVRQNQPFVVSAVVQNVSSHEGDSPAIDVVLCMWMVHFGCKDGLWTYLSRASAPAIPAQSEHEMDLPATLRLEAMPYPELAYQATLRLCLVPPGHAGPYLPDGFICVDESNDLIYRPDYESCNPPVAQLGQMLTLHERNCGEAAGTSRHFFLMAFDAEEGVAYDIEPNHTMYDADGDVVSRSSPANLPAGRYYLVTFHEQSAWVRVSLAESGG